MKVHYSLVALALFFCCGLYFSVFSSKFSQEKNYSFMNSMSSGVARDPAAIRRTYDFSGLDGSALAKAQKMRLLSGAKVVREKSDVGVELGHFVLKGEGGEKTFACQKYEKVSMTFAGDGSAINGELPRMEVEGLCEMSADINSISPLWIPVAKILGEPVADGEFSFMEGRPISVRFANVSDQWPKMWQLQSVRLFNGTKDEVVIQGHELRDILAKPLLVEWK
jgi:hypothetical protein